MGLFDIFKALFRREESESSDEPDSPVAAPASKPSVGVRPGIRTLIIDDSKTVVMAIRKALLTEGYKTFEAYDAESGLGMIHEHKPQLIFLDIMLPGMNGFAALRMIRRDPLTRDIPVIMMSGNEQAMEQFYGSRIGADDFIKKPFSSDELLLRIEKLLDRNGVPRRVEQSATPAAQSAAALATAR